MTRPYTHLLATIIATLAIVAGATSCKDQKSYVELTNIENEYVNNFLADHHVTNQQPTDTTFVFETGPDAPYYRLDEDGMLYMQVINPGTPGNYATDNQLIYFRFTRYNLKEYKDGKLGPGDGNETDMTYRNAWFRMDNYTLESSYQWGAGVQQPLKYLPIDCEVNLVVKSQYGFYEEQAYVTPYLYRIRYYKQLT